MKKVRLLTFFATMTAAFASMSAQAGMVTDQHGNVGYDTAAECDAAVLSGNAKFYQSVTHHKPLLRAGEKNVQRASIRDLGAQYARGACDIGAARKLGRDGVSKALQGKYVPFSPDMAINVYTDAQGNPVRVTMQQCDNWFSGNAPRPVAIPTEPMREEPRVEAPAPIVAAAPMAAAPMMAKSGVSPYVFGTLGSLQDGLKLSERNSTNNWVDDSDWRFAGQVGLGVQFNRYLGLEGYYQGAQKHELKDSQFSDVWKSQNNTYGARFTLGNNITDNARLFLKAGVAGVKQKLTDNGSPAVYDKTKARPTAGVGFTYGLTDNLSLRGDYDHVFKHGSQNTNINDVEAKWKGTNYLGMGLQYNFR